MFKKLHKGQRGFTLIELLIVIAVLGILAAVVIPNVSSFLHSGHIAAGNSELASVKTADQGFAAENGGTNFAATQGPNQTNGNLSTYLANNGAGVLGWYDFDVNGNCVTATYPNLSVYDSTNQKFSK